MKKISKAIVKPTKKNIMNTVRTINRTGKLLISGSDEYPPNVKQILSQYGSQIIKSIKLERTPVDEVMTGALSLFSLGKFGERFNKSFDELFHLFMEIEMQNGEYLLLEKNARINMQVKSSPINRPNSEIKNVEQVPQNLTIQQVMDNARQRMGNKFFQYDAVVNNCQDFLLNVLQANGIGNQSDYDFIKQNTEKLFKGLPILKKVSHAVTEIGERADIAMQGGAVNPVNASITNYAQFLDHLTSHITDPDEPIDGRDFAQAIKIINIIKQLKESKKSGATGGSVSAKPNIKIDIQSIVFLKNDGWTATKARKWLKERKMKNSKPTETDNTIKFTQIDASKYSEFKSRKIKGGIILVFGLM